MKRGITSDSVESRQAVKPRPSVESRIVLMLFGVVLSYVPPALSYRVFQARGPYWVYPAAFFVSLVFGLLQRYGVPRRQGRDRGWRPGWDGRGRRPEKSRGRRPRRLQFAAFMPALGLGGFILLELNLTPGAAYVLWFESFSRTIPSGTISYFMFLKLALFSLISMNLWLRDRYILSVCSLLFPSVLIAATIFASVWLMLLSFSLLTAALFLLNKSFRRRLNVRYLMMFLGILCVAAAVALPLASMNIPDFALFSGTLTALDLEPMIIRIFPAFPMVSGLPGYENPAAATGLGGRPALGSTPLFYVSGPPGDTLYMRTLTYDTFIWNSWFRRLLVNQDPEDPAAGIERPEGREKLEGPPPHTPEQGSGPAAPRSPVRRLAQDQSLPSDALEVEVAADFYSSVPHLLDSAEIVFYEPPRLAEGNFSTGVVIDPPLLRGTRFFVSRAQNSAGAEEISESTAEPYLQVFEQIPEEIVALAEELKRDTPLETIDAIKAYLSARYTYSLDAPKPPNSQHFLAHFLFELQRGYCVHFATAFTVLCRLNGIPARYVTGYLVYLPRPGGSATVSELQSHAWSEVWRADSGWTTVEATPAIGQLSPSAAAGSGGIQVDFDALDAMTRRQLLSLRGGESGVSIPPSSIAWGGAAVLLMLISGVLIYAHLSERRLGSRQTAFLPNSVRKVIRHFERQQVPHPEEIGWVEWHRKVQATGRVSRLHGGLFVKRVLIVLYRENDMSRRDRRYFRLASKQLRSAHK